MTLQATTPQAQHDTVRRPGVGVALFLLDGRGRFVLMRRRGSHGAGSWGLNGGHLEFGRTPIQAAVDEAAEELGLVVDPVDVIVGPYTNDVFPDEEKHYVTLFMATRLPADQVPRNMEPEKCDAFDFFDYDGAMPDPLFVPFANFRAAHGPFW